MCTPTPLTKHRPAAPRVSRRSPIFGGSFDDSTCAMGGETSHPARTESVAMELIGRTEAITAVIECSSAMVLLTGDSGIGKSAVLDVLDDYAAAKVIAPRTRRLQSHDGSLQSSLLEALAEACAIFAESRPAGRQLADAISRASTTIANASGKEFARFLEGQLKGLIRARLGSEAADAFIGLTRSIAHPQEELLATRLRKSADADAVSAVLALAAETQQVIGKILVRLDNCERLTADDHALAMDLPELLGDGIRVITGYATRNSNDMRRVRELRARGAMEVKIPALGESDVAAWVASTDVAPSLTREIYQASAGYPLFIDSAIRHIERGHTLDSLPELESFAATTEQAWIDLSSEARLAARQLLPFDEPPPVDRITQVLTVSSSVWNTLREELCEARIFAVEIDGNPWFHERRRQLIWTHTLRQGERSEIAERTVDLLESWIGPASEPGKLESLIAELVPITRHYRDEPAIAATVDLSPVELALLFSLVELMEPTDEDGPAFVDTNQLIDFAITQFSLTSETVPAIESLESKRLIHVASNDHASIMTAIIPNQLVASVLYGRFIRQFGRVPVARAATAAFELAFRSRISPFDVCAYGIGDPKIGGNFDKLNRQSKVWRSNPPRISVRGSYGGRPFYLDAQFTSKDQRDSALAHVAGLEVEVFGDHLRVDEAYALPIHCVAANRFLAAAGTLTSKNIGLWGNRVPAADREYDPIEASEIELQVHRFIAARVSGIERSILGLSADLLIAVESDPNSGYRRVKASVEAGRGGVRMFPFPSTPRTATGPLWQAYYAKELSLNPGERVQKAEYSTRGVWDKDPALSAMYEFSTLAARFNKHQLPFAIPADPTQLESLLTDALTEQLRLGTEMRDAGIPILGDRAQPIACEYWILLHDAPRGWEHIWGITYGKRPADEPAVHIQVASLSDSLDSEFHRRFGLMPDELPSNGRGNAASVLSELLGHRREDARLPMRPRRQ